MNTWPDSKKPYKSDGCTMWPDGPNFNCCKDHDDVYRWGGDWQQRLVCDIILMLCVKGNSGWFWAVVMFIGVRIGGSPFLPTPWRWGFGHQWPKYKD